MQDMARRSIALVFLIALGTSTIALSSTGAGALSAYRPDAWIKLCGLSTGCTINPLPHPWKGNDIYNTTGFNQTIKVRMEDGEGVRFWLTFENDVELDDTIVVDGCKGNRRFRVNKVVIGFVKGPQAGTVKITDAFKAGTATFDLGPSSENDRVELTLNFIAPTTAEGVSYKCPITIRSQNDPTAQDTIAAKMTTY